MRRALLWLFAASLWLLTAAVGGNDDLTGYIYPITDPFEATVTGTPPDLRYKVEKERPMQVKSFDLEIFAGRDMPPLFRPVRRLNFTLAYQEQASPLVFVIAGTGSSHRAATARFLQHVFYQAGFHVITLSSPTSYEFIASASESRVPGVSADDAKDLYRVMQLSLQRTSDLAPVTDVYLTGYSLGGLHAAFVSHRDEQEQAIGFRKVLLLNPPVSLYTSASMLDALVGSDPRMKNAHVFFNALFEKFTEYFKENGMIRLDDEAFLFKFQESEQSLQQKELMALVGAAFRFTSAGLVFTVDALNGTGHVVEKDQRLTVGTPLEQYFKRGLWWRFTDYFERLLIPHWQQRHPQGSRDQLIEKISLSALGNYLAGAHKIGVISNADEIILSPEDIHFLTETFGSRATIFPRGGHLGNIQHRDYVTRILTFFGRGAAAEGG
jgi:hypothetical protein